MQIDRYTKAILTVIAAALTVIAVRGFTPPASAMGSGCGLNPREPCYVESGLTAFYVTLDPESSVKIKSDPLSPVYVRTAAF